MYSGYKSQYQRRLVYLFACTWKCVFQMVPTCPGLFPPDPSRTAWKWQLQFRQICFASHDIKCFPWDVSKTQNPKTNHAFLDTMAGKSAIPGSPGKHCRQSERNNQKKIAELHDWVFSFFSLFCLWNRDNAHSTAINTFQRRIFEEMGGALASRTLTAQLLWQRP